ncbi:DNA-processing protein DprA [Amniculibacterium aquaticum]|uniref:DNA-processing protein DprA n=1 Tax=Amniculibacterium aquaticum TaxID=2479858 RepID=UPI000F59BE98|nr:DNA-processing protein DprA [Amniculibacterium aquaticum]
MFTDEHLYSIALRKCALIGDINFHKLVSKFGSAQEIWKTSHSNLGKMNGLGRKTIAEIGNTEHLKFAEKELTFCEKNAVKIWLRHQKDFPKLLNECDDAPSILYHKGSYDESYKCISMVGTRHVTSYGKNFVENFISSLPNCNIKTVSGLAVGADTEVHEQSIKHNRPTIAVLAHGFQTLYPSKNKFLAEKILEHGGMLITEFNSSQKPDPQNFIQRNRIVAGLSEATIVVETAFGGGSISTVSFANNYNRDIYALPGRIGDKYSQGCNQLIAQNKASTISTINNLIENLNLTTKESVGELFPKNTTLELSPSQQKIFDAVSSKNDISLDELSEILQIPGHQLLGSILELELMNILKSTSSRQYRINKKYN